MPRATTDRFIRAHQPSAKASSSKTAASTHSDSSAVHNPIFNTERFGQHILKNPLVAQG
jgi:18S rRNA (adenine1779-N6/adenine1780-N6)-dimethyltransferase